MTPRTSPSTRIVLLIAGLAALPAAAEEVACPGTVASVDAADPALVGSVCSAVRRASEFLERCGLAVTAPVEIRVSDEPEGLAAGCLGLYECEAQQIRLRPPEAMQELRASFTFEGMDALVLFESIVAHEWAHAAFEHSACGSALCVDNHEYVANVTQVWSLPDEVRLRFLAEHPSDGPVDPDLLNGFIAAFAPDRFAALAWQHFNEPGNGCAFIEDLTAGRQTLRLRVE